MNQLQLYSLNEVRRLLHGGRHASSHAAGALLACMQKLLTLACLTNSWLPAKKAPPFSSPSSSIECSRFSLFFSLRCHPARRHRWRPAAVLPTPLPHRRGGVMGQQLRRRCRLFSRPCPSPSDGCCGGLPPPSPTALAARGPSPLLPDRGAVGNVPSSLVLRC